MFFNILLRDLKRKKTMNIILLLFTILAALFVASGVNNVVTVLNGTDYFLSEAGIRDYIIFSQYGDESVEDIIKASEYVTGYSKEASAFISKENCTKDEKKLDFKSTVVLQCISKDGMKFFDKENRVINDVNKGEIYLTVGSIKNADIKIGDEIEIKVGNIQKTFKVAGEFKDGLFGSSMMGNTRMLVHPDDYADFDTTGVNKVYSAFQFYIDCTNISEFESEISAAKFIAFNCARSMIEMSYVMEMIIAMIVLVLSVCLIIVSFVILKFVITFTINEEYREIGVLKAIGIKNFKIRSLYIVKYLAMAVVGGIIGLIISFPFGKLLMDSVTEKMVMGDEANYYLNLYGAIAVVMLIVLSAYLCTGKVKKSTPVDAIRNGQTGERYNKKTGLRISSSHFGNPLFMSVNDFLSAPRRFFTIILTFFLCSIFVLGVEIVVDTMNSDKLIETFGKKSDLYINDSKYVNLESMGEKGEERQQQIFDELEGYFADKGYTCRVSVEIWYNYPLTIDGRRYNMTFQQNKGTKASDYSYIEGSAPQNKNEIAITPSIAEKLQAKIGDTVTIDFGSEKLDCIITATFQTMNQLGEMIRLHEDAPAKMLNSMAIMAYLVDFDDNPTASQIIERKEMLKNDKGIEEVFDSKEYCADCIGVGDSLGAVAKLLLIITMIVVSLVTILMERSFISDEKSQIALMKAIGFKDRMIIKWHVIRFTLVALIAELLALIVLMPITKLWCDPIWAMMGAHDVDYAFNPLTVLVIFPGVILLTTLVAAALTALYTKSIKSNDIANIE